MSSPVRFDAWQFKKPIIVTERNRKKITLSAFSANCGSALFGKSVYFNGSLGSSPGITTVLGDTSFTIESWINIKGQQNDRLYPIFYDRYRNTNPFDPRYLIAIYNRFVYLFYRKGGTVFLIASITEVATAYNWTHIAVSWDGVTVKMYINGILDKSQAVASPVDTPLVSGMAIGGTRYLGDIAFAGNIAELRIWYSARTLDQIQFFRFTQRDITQVIDNDLAAYYRLGGLVSANTVKEYILGANQLIVPVDCCSDDTTTGPPLNYGASFVAAQWPITLSGKSSIKFPVVPPSGTTFALVIRWTDDNGNVQRRFLWTVAGVDISPIPSSYQGEALPSSFVLEAWNIDGNSIIVLPSDLVIYNSLTSLPSTDVDHESQIAAGAIIDTTLAANFPLTPFPLVYNTQQTYPN